MIVSAILVPHILYFHTLRHTYRSCAGRLAHCLPCICFLPLRLMCLSYDCDANFAPPDVYNIQILQYLWLLLLSDVNNLAYRIRREALRLHLLRVKLSGFSQVTLISILFILNANDLAQPSCQRDLFCITTVWDFFNTWYTSIPWPRLYIPSTKIVLIKCTWARGNLVYI